MSTSWHPISDGSRPRSLRRQRRQILSVHFNLSNRNGMTITLYQSFSVDGWGGPALQVPHEEPGPSRASSA